MSYVKGQDPWRPADYHDDDDDGHFGGRNGYGDDGAQPLLNERFPRLNYFIVLLSQLPLALDTSKIDVIVVSGRGLSARVTNIFSAGRWRWIAVLRACLRILVVFLVPLLPIYLGLLLAARMVARVVERYTRLAGFSNRHARTYKLSVPLELSAIKVESYSTLAMSFASRALWSTWAFAAGADTFEKIYVQAWTEHYHYNYVKDVRMVSIFVDGESVRVPIPCGISELNGSYQYGCDTATSEILLMWYSWLRVKKGFGEILLPKRLVRINKVELNGSDLSMGRRIRTLEFGRNGESNVEFLRSPAKIPPGQMSITQDIADNTRLEGLEFVRSWDSFAVSIITLMPLVLSLVFAGVWTGVSINKYSQDAQVATQTAFTVASYIITAGALVIALFAFLDGSSSRGGDLAVAAPPRQSRRESKRPAVPIRAPRFSIPRTSISSEPSIRSQRSRSKRALKPRSMSIASDSPVDTGVWASAVREALRAEPRPPSPIYAGPSTIGGRGARPAPEMSQIAQRDGSQDFREI